jgi:O-antigen/teichoic acid export membrane protein
MSLSVRTLRGAAWTTVATSTQAVMQVVVLAVLARHVTAREFGMIAVTQVFTGILQLVAEGGFWGAVVQRSELTRGHLQAAYALGAGFPLLPVLLFWALSPSFAAFFHAGDLVLLLRVMSFYSVLTGWGLVARARLERDLDFRRLFILDTVAYALGYTVVAVAGAYLGWGVWALAAAILGRAALFTVLVNLVCRPVLGFGFGRAELRDMFGFGAGFTLGRLLDYFAWQADYLVVGRLLGVSPLGFYQRAFELMELPGRYLGKVAEKVLFSSMAQLQTRREALASAFCRTVEISSLMVLPVTVWMLIAAPELVRVLYGPRWLPVVPVLQVLLTTPLLRTSGRVAEALSRATGAVYRNVWRKAVAMLTVAGGAWIGHFWGIQGVALGASLAICGNAMLLLHLATRLAGVGWGRLLASYKPAATVSAAATAAALPLLLLLRAGHAPALVSGGLSGIAGALAAGVLVHLRPALLGASGPWLLQRMRQALRREPAGAGAEALGPVYP